MTVQYPIANYQNRYDPAQHYDKHLFRSRMTIQAADHNEVQENMLARIKSVGDMIAKDGNIVDRGACVIDTVTGVVQLEDAKIYLQGTVRDLLPASFTVPVNDLVAVGVRLVETIITELEDPFLVGQAQGTRGYGEPGAARLG